MEYSEFEKNYESKYRTLNFKFINDSFEIIEYKEIVLKKDCELIKITAKNRNAKSEVFTNSYAIFDFAISNINEEKSFTPLEITDRNICKKEDSETFQNYKDFFDNKIGEILYINPNLMVCAIDEHSFEGGVTTALYSLLTTFYLDSLQTPDLFINHFVSDDFDNITSYGLIRYQGKWTARLRNHFSFSAQTYRDFFKESMLNTDVIGFDELPYDWKTLKTEFPSITDAFMSPDKKWFFTLTKSELKIYKIANNQISIIPLKTIQLLTNECIVGINWEK
jgi:hypothetical protein